MPEDAATDKPYQSFSPLLVWRIFSAGNTILGISLAEFSLHFTLNSSTTLFSFASCVWYLWGLDLFHYSSLSHKECISSNFEKNITIMICDPSLLSELFNILVASTSWIYRMCPLPGPLLRLVILAGGQHRQGLRHRHKKGAGRPASVSACCQRECSIGSLQTWRW